MVQIESQALFSNNDPQHANVKHSGKEKKSIVFKRDTLHEQLL